MSDELNRVVVERRRRAMARNVADVKVKDAIELLDQAQATYESLGMEQSDEAARDAISAARGILSFGEED